MALSNLRDLTHVTAIPSGACRPACQSITTMSHCCEFAFTVGCVERAAARRD